MQNTSPTNHYTKAQLEKLFQSWGVAEALPKNGRDVIVSFPGERHWHRVCKTLLKGTDGRLLYSVTRQSFS